MKDCSPNMAPIVKGDRFNLNQCLRNIPYASVVGSLMYAQVCTRHGIAFVVGMLGRYQSNPGIEHWTIAKESVKIYSRNQKLQAYI